MSTATDTRSGAPASSLASSTVFRTFAVVFAIAAPIIYVICEMRNWPLFTYHPGTNRIDWLYAPPVRDQGPAMHYYGWTANMLIGSAILGILAAFAVPKFIALDGQARVATVQGLAGSVRSAASLARPSAQSEYAFHTALHC